MMDAKETTMTNQEESRCVKSLKSFIQGLICALMLTSVPVWAQTGGTVTYVYTDPLGTPLAETDSSGHITATFEYTPYGTYAPQGTSTPGPVPNGPGYTGQVNDPEIDLVYMQARYYDPETGRFLSIDPVRPEPKQTVIFNRYAYANNNPIEYSDPTGDFPGDGNECASAGFGCKTFYFNDDGGGGGAGQNAGAGKAAPIIGNGQRSINTPTHASTSERIAAEQSVKPGVKAVYLHRGLRKITGNPKFPNIFADVTTVYENGSMDLHEIPSKGQTDESQEIKLANVRAATGLPGKDFVIRPDPVPEGMVLRGLGVLGVVQMIFHEWVNHYIEQREEAKMTPEQRQELQNIRECGYKLCRT